MSGFRRRYGAGPLHLAVHGLALALVAWAVAQIAGIGGSLSVLKWFVAAVIVHDAILLPLYVGLDRGVQAGVAVATGGERGRVRALDHVRVPLALSAATFVAFSPLLLDESAPVLEQVSTFAPSGYLARWAIFTGVLFALSGLLYLVRLHAAAERAAGRERGLRRGDRAPQPPA